MSGRHNWGRYPYRRSGISNDWRTNNMPDIKSRRSHALRTAAGRPTARIGDGRRSWEQTGTD